MTTQATNSTPTALLAGRHIAGMMLLAAANPLIYYSDAKVTTWASTWLMPLAFAAAAFALYALFFTRRAKAAGPGRFFMLAWVLLAMMVVGPYLDSPRKPAQSVVPINETHPARQAAPVNWSDFTPVDTPNAPAPGQQK